MKPFKFLQKNYMGGFLMEELYSINQHNSEDTFDLTRSELIREWMVDYYYNQPLGSEAVKYFPEFDRTCVLNTVGVEAEGDYEKLVTIIKIKSSETSFIEVSLAYWFNKD